MTDGTQQSSSQSGTQSTQAGGGQQGNGSQGSQAGQTTQGSQTQGQQGSQQQQVATRPEYVPEAHWDAAAGKVKDDAALTTHFNEIIARDAAAQSAKLALPQTVDAYKVELPASFQPPQGVEFKIDDANPLWAQAKVWAHKFGISQEAFAEGIGLIAGDRIATAQQVNDAKTAEIAKLGATGPARVDAVTTVFKATLGDADGALLASRMFTARDVEVAEKLVAKLTSQGAATFRGNGREPPTQPGRVSEAEYAAMTPAQKWDYSRSFDQRQFQSNGQGR